VKPRQPVLFGRTSRCQFPPEKGEMSVELHKLPISSGSFLFKSLITSKLIGLAHKKEVKNAKNYRTNK